MIAEDDILSVKEDIMKDKPSGLECTGCGLYFRGLAAFDKHRVGSYQPMTRRCMTASEMLQSGLVLKNDVWGFPMTEQARAYFERLKLSV